MKKKESQPRKCFECNGEFSRPLYYSTKQWEKRKYCSRKCSLKNYSSRQNKLWEKEEYRKHMSIVHSAEKSHMWKGGSNEWCSRKANAVYNEHHLNVVCEKCGSPNDICIHHKDKNRRNNAIENLQALCRPCHCSLHKKGVRHDYRTKSYR